MVGNDKLTIPTCHPRPTNRMGLGKRFFKMMGTVLRKLAGTGVTHQRHVKRRRQDGYKRHVFFFSVVTSR